MCGAYPGNAFLEFDTIIDSSRMIALEMNINDADDVISKHHDRAELEIITDIFYTKSV
jgi:hypothetical protein